MWKVSKAEHALAWKTAPPKAEWKRGQHFNVSIGISEYHDKALFTKLFAAFQASEAAYKKVSTMTGRSKEKDLSWSTAKRAKEEAKACITAGVVSLLGPSAGESEKTVTVNSIRVHEGDERNRRVLKADTTLLATTATKLRATSGVEGIFVDTCGYDEDRKRRERQEERWIPLVGDSDGGGRSRQEALSELKALGGEHYGLHLNRDGCTFKLRVPSAREEEGWQRVHERRPPPHKRYVIERVPASIPFSELMRMLRSTIGWEAETTREQMRGRGRWATKRVTVKARGPPAADCLDLDGQTVNIREEVSFNNTRDEEAPSDDFFRGFDSVKAANTVLKAAGKAAHTTTKYDEKAKTYAYAVLGHDGETTPAPSRPNRPATSQRSASTVTPSAITTAVEETMAQRGAAISEFKDMMGQMQKMMEQCAALMRNMQTGAAEGEPEPKKATSVGEGEPEPKKAKTADEEM